jgi:3-oxoadipate enol-lactonase
MAAMAFDSRRRLAEIKCPTLVVAASRDESVPLHHAKMLHDGITGSKLVIIDGADHALIWARANELVRVIDEFLGAGSDMVSSRPLLDKRGKSQREQ